MRRLIYKLFEAGLFISWLSYPQALNKIKHSIHKLN